MNNPKKKEDYIKIHNKGINYGFTVYVHKEEDQKHYTVVIPSFGICFTVDDEESIQRRSKVMVKVFFDHWIKHNSMKYFILEIHKLGFKSPNHNLIVKNIIRGKSIDAKFSNTVVNENGELVGEVIQVDGEMELV